MQPLRRTTPPIQQFITDTDDLEIRTEPFQAMPGEINHDPLDRFTFVHASMGVLMGLFRAPWWVALLAALLTDTLERPLKYRFPYLFPNYTQDTAQHVVTDAAAWMMGWAAAKQLRDRAMIRKARRLETQGE